MSLFDRVRAFFTFPPLPTALMAVTTDDDAKFFDEIRYLEDLEDAILRAVVDTKHAVPREEFLQHTCRPLLQAVAIPAAPELPPWPVDYAAHLLGLWRMDSVLDAYLDGRDW